MRRTSFDSTAAWRPRLNEPHFLFNTLANVRSLYQTDAATASLMLDNLVRYPAIALPRMRESATSLVSPDNAKIELAVRPRSP